jgi:hypothetical protein
MVLSLVFPADFWLNVMPKYPLSARLMLETKDVATFISECFVSYSSSDFFLFPFGFFFFSGSTRVCTQGLTLARQVLYHLSHTPSPFSDFFFLKIMSMLNMYKLFP